MYALLQVVLKEFFQLRQDKKMIPVMIVGPLVAAHRPGLRGEPGRLRHSRWCSWTRIGPRPAATSSIASRARATSSSAGTEDTAARVEPWLVEGRAQIALVIGQGYGADTTAGRTASVQVIADGTDSNSAVVGLGYASRIVSGVGRRGGPRPDRPRVPPGPRVVAGAGGGCPGQIELVPRIWYNPDLKSRWFFVPAVLAMVLMLVTMMLPSMAVVREREIGTLEQISVTPLRPWQLIVGKLRSVRRRSASWTCCSSWSWPGWIFGVPLRGSLLLLTFLTLLFLLNTLGLGLLVSTLVNTQQQAMMFAAFVLMVPMIYLSGLVFPIENMPRLFQLGAASSRCATTGSSFAACS